MRRSEEVIVIQDGVTYVIRDGVSYQIQGPRPYRKWVAVAVGFLGFLALLAPFGFGLSLLLGIVIGAGTYAASRRR